MSSMFFHTFSSLETVKLKSVPLTKFRLECNGNNFEGKLNDFSRQKPIRENCARVTWLVNVTGFSRNWVYIPTINIQVVLNWYSILRSQLIVASISFGNAYRRKIENAILSEDWTKLNILRYCVEVPLRSGSHRELQEERDKPRKLFDSIPVPFLGHFKVSFLSIIPFSLHGTISSFVRRNATVSTNPPHKN